MTLPCRSVVRRHALSGTAAKALSAVLAAALLLAPAAPHAQTVPAAKPFEPVYGQEGKDVIWVPTQPLTIERMLRMAQVTPRDVVVDLGSGDGRITIAAAKDFGARAYGYEYNPDMVALSQHEAEKAGVGNKVEFRKADIFDTDFSHATVVTMYLLPHLNVKLRPIILNMKPGIRVVSHQFDMGEWKPDEVSDQSGRRINFWLVPAKVDGEWKLSFPGRDYTLSLRQEFQMISGWLTTGPGQMGLRDAVLTGSTIRFSFVDEQSKLHTFNGNVNVNGNAMSGTVTLQGGAPVAFNAVKKP